MAVGGDLTVTTLLNAYSSGIFPWYSPGSAILWWCPNPRFVLELPKFHIPHGLARRLREDWVVTADHTFEEVIQCCAKVPRFGQSGTWITHEMRHAYHALYEAGYAHSIEVWRDNRLIGGLYGVALGRAFFGESMFHRETDASKIALLALVNHLRRHEYVFIDCQQPTTHLGQFGAENWPRNRFLDALDTALATSPKPGSWRDKTFSTKTHEDP